MSAHDSDPEIDFNHLNQYVGGDKSLTAEVFGLFKHQVEMWGRALIVDADDETWASVTHSLRGTALAVGATKLAQLCENAEDLVGDGNRPGGREVALQNIEFRISRTMAEIQRWEYRQTLNQMRGQ
ncbi:Hpt domain-containing protein [Hellea balneolensis]|uniref:Hpt domain-containing protein n=1 Tax=Hellea balneolensis TaxID=287478 RepID=UPI00041CDFAB|nr:Hpt domain-containing protein [Hellea balneolensis]